MNNTSFVVIGSLESPEATLVAAFKQLQEGAEGVLFQKPDHPKQYWVVFSEVLIADYEDSVYRLVAAIQRALQSADIQAFVYAQQGSEKCSLPVDRFLEAFSNFLKRPWILILAGPNQLSQIGEAIEKWLIHRQHKAI